jgi:hypothetical protein
MISAHWHPWARAPRATVAPLQQDIDRAAILELLHEQPADAEHTIDPLYTAFTMARCIGTAVGRPLVADRPGYLGRMSGRVVLVIGLRVRLWSTDETCRRSPRSLSDTALA